MRGLANPARWRRERREKRGTKKGKLLEGMELEVMERERGISRVGSSTGVVIVQSNMEGYRERGLC